MGASIGNALGFEKAIGQEFASKMVAVIGDSTFVHSGITGLADVAYNKGATTVIIVDNSITAMTGHQHHPGTGMTLMGEPTTKVDYIALAESLGVKDARRVNAYDMPAVKAAIKEAAASTEPTLLVMEGACALMVRKTWTEPMEIDAEKCVACGLCLKLGCPAISKDENGKSTINPLFCVGETLPDVRAGAAPSKAISPSAKVTA